MESNIELAVTHPLPALTGSFDLIGHIVLLSQVVPQLKEMILRQREGPSVNADINAVGSVACRKKIAQPTH